MLLGFASLLLLLGNAVAEEIRVPFQSAPAAVKATIEREFHGSPPASLDRETHAGKTVFEAERTVPGSKETLIVDDAGKVVEIEREIPIAELPPAARATVDRRFAGATLRKAEAVYLAGAATVSVYEVELRVGGKNREVKVSPEGKIVH